MKTVVGLYDSFDDAQSTVRDLRDSGFRSEDVSMIARDTTGEYTRYFENQNKGIANDAAADQNVADGTAAGAGIGAVVGGLGGLLVGLGALAIPGIGPVLAAGPLVAALAGAGIGAVTGGIIGALVDLGITEEHAHYYAEGVRRGGTLVVVRTDDMLADQAMTIMNRHNPVDIGERMKTWRADNWTGFNPQDEPLPDEKMEFNRDYVPVTGADRPVDYDMMDREIPGTHTTERDLLNDRDPNPPVNSETDIPPDRRNP